MLLRTGCELPEQRREEIGFGAPSEGITHSRRCPRGAIFETPMTTRALLATICVALSCGKTERGPAETRQQAPADSVSPVDANAALRSEASAPFPKGYLASERLPNDAPAEPLSNTPGVPSGPKSEFRALGDSPDPGFYTRAYAVSSDGSAIVGVQGIAPPRPPEADMASTVTRFPDPPLPPPKEVHVVWSTSGVRSVPLEGKALNGDGSVVVGSGAAIFGGRHSTQAARLAGGAAEGLGSLGSCLGQGDPGSAATGVSTDGATVVGISTAWQAESQEAFLWTRGAMQGLGDLPGGSFYSVANGVSSDGSVVVGYGTSQNGNEAYRWTRETGMVGLGDLPGGTFESRATAVSADGRVIIGFGFNAAGRSPFRWEGGIITDIGRSVGGQSGGIAQAVSGDGSVIVGSGNGKGRSQESVFLWDRVHGMRSLREALRDHAVDTTGWVLQEALGISADGSTIVGNGLAPGGRLRGWVARLVP